MCAVSVVLDYMDKRVPLESWTIPIYSDFQEIIRRLEELDKKLDQADCIDPRKEKLLGRIERHLEALTEQE